MTGIKNIDKLSYETIRQRIEQNEFGTPGQPFMSIKEFSRRFSIGMDKAQAIFFELRDEGLIKLCRKKHYLSHGVVLSDSPLGKLRQERKLIAILADHLESYYIPSFADSAAAYLTKEGYQIILTIVHEKNYKSPIDELYNMGVRGLLLLVDSNSSEQISRNSKMPCVISGYDCTEFGVDSVVSGGSEQAKHLADMMLEAGCESFFFVTPRRETLEEKATYNAFYNRLLQKSKTNVSDMVIAEREVKNNSNFLLQKLSGAKGKVGIVCTNEQLTQYVMRCCMENKISVPDKVMLAAFRTKSPMNQQNRSIITVEENIEREAAECVALILKRIRGDNSPARLITVEPKVVNRLNE